MNTVESKHELRTVSELYRGACEYTRFPFTAQTGFFPQLEVFFSVFFFCSFFVRFIVRFWVPKRELFGVIFGAKIDTELIINEVSCEKTHFGKSAFSPNGSTTLKDCSASKLIKNSSKRVLERYFSHLFFCLRFGRVLGPIFLSFWLPKWSEVGSKVVQTNDQNR